MEPPNQFKLSEHLSPAYKPYWNSKKFYRAIKGSKGSGKSKTAALWHIYFMKRYRLANTLVIKRTYASIKDSVFKELVWAIRELGMEKEWAIHKHPTLELELKATGQTIMFKGMDDALKLASITAANGPLCWVWIEEAADLPSEEEFDRLMMSIRGRMPPDSGLWKGCTLTFNPWSEHHWLKKRFFDNPSDDTLAMTTTYKDVIQFLDEADFIRYEELRVRNPRAARVICDGDWGIAEGLIYENWDIQEFNISQLIAQKPHLKLAFGLDFGFKGSYNAFAAVAFDFETYTLYLFDEMYNKGLVNKDIARIITEMGYQKETIIADSADIKSITDLREGFHIMDTDEDGIPITDSEGNTSFSFFNLPNVRPSMKGPDSVRHGIQALQSFRWIVHPRCENAIMELRNYCYKKDADDNYTTEPIKDFDHMMDAIRYASERYFLRGKGKVYEAKGVDVDEYVETKPTKPKSKRVFSTG